MFPHPNMEDIFMCCILVYLCSHFWVTYPFKRMLLNMFFKETQNLTLSVILLCIYRNRFQLNFSLLAVHNNNSVEIVVLFSQLLPQSMLKKHTVILC